MKKTVLFLLLGLALLPACKNASKGAGTFLIEGGRVEVNHQVMAGSGWKLSLLAQALGEPNRVFNGANDIHTYDSKGIALYENPGTGVVNEVYIQFGKPTEEYEFTPKDMYKGTFTIEKMKITSAVTPAELQRRLPEYNFVLSYSKDIYRGVFRGTYIFAHFTPDLKALTGLSIGVD